MARKRSVHRGSGAPSTDDPGAWKHLIGPDFPSEAIIVETRQLNRGFQIGAFRPIRVDHTNCLQVAIKTHSFTPPGEEKVNQLFNSICKK